MSGDPQHAISTTLERIKQLDLLLHTGLWDGLWCRLNDGRCRLFHHRGHDIRNLNRALLKLGRKLLVQEIPNHEYCYDGHDVKDVERGLGRDILDNSTLGVIDYGRAH